VLERWLALVALLAGAFAASAAPEGGASAAAGEHTVIIENMQFAPATLAVRRGERVVWVKRDLVAHTVTAQDKGFDSRAIPAGGRWSTVATRAGRFGYACAFHPTMTGVLAVQ